MDISQMAYRRKRVLEQCKDRDDKGCGNCAHGNVNIEFMVHCEFDNQHAYDPEHGCDKHHSDVRLALLRGDI